MARKTFIAVVCMLLVMSGCGFLQDDVAFSRTAMNLLIKGRFIVRPMIEWQSFRVLDLEVGKQYAQYKTGEERAGYERAFIESFAQGYKETKATFKTFYNWRKVPSADPKLGVVAANHTNDKTIFYFDIKHQGWNKKLMAIRMEIKQ